VRRLTCDDGTAVDVVAFEDGVLAVDGQDAAGRRAIALTSVDARDVLEPRTCAVSSDSRRVTFHGSFTPAEAGGWGPFGEWDGSACVETTAFGAAHVRTRNMRWTESICPNEPASGTEVLRAGEHVARVRFDGDTSCTDAVVATWRLDGVPQGEIALSCSIAFVRPQSAANRFWLLLPALALLLPRRTSRGSA